MGTLFGLNWRSILLPSISPVEIFVRGTVVYLTIFALLRILKRETGELGISDLLVLVLIADAAQNAMAGAYTSVPEGILLVATIIFWSYALDWLGYRFPALERLIHSPPLPLVRDGEMLLRNMRRQLITREELMSYLREQGVENLAEVKAAYMESDGRISVITRGGGGGGTPRRRAE